MVLFSGGWSRSPGLPLSGYSLDGLHRLLDGIVQGNMLSRLVTPENPGHVFVGLRERDGSVFGIVRR